MAHLSCYSRKWATTYLPDIVDTFPGTSSPLQYGFAFRGIPLKPFANRGNRVCSCLPVVSPSSASESGLVARHCESISGSGHAPRFSALVRSPGSSSDTGTPGHIP